MSKRENRDQGHNQREQAEKRRESGGSYQGGENSRQTVRPDRGPQPSREHDTSQGGDEMGRDETRGDSNRSAGR